MLWNSPENKVLTFASQPSLLRTVYRDLLYFLGPYLFLIIWGSNVINGRSWSLFWPEGSLLGPNRGEYLSHHIWNYLSANMGWSETVWRAQPDNLNCISLAKALFLQSIKTFRCSNLESKSTCQKIPKLSVYPGSDTVWRENTKQTAEHKRLGKPSLLWEKCAHFLPVFLQNWAPMKN